MGYLIIQCAATAGLLADPFRTQSPSTFITFPSVYQLREHDYANVSDSYSNFMFPSRPSENPKQMDRLELTAVLSISTRNLIITGYIL